MERYSDHAANERTFLAWIRTAIAVMAFGFLVEGSIYFWRSPVSRSRGARFRSADSPLAMLPA
jgi:putative membrane protein